MSNTEVYAVMSISNPVGIKTYSDYKDAEEEAIRICRIEKINTYVAKIVTCVSVSDVVVERFD